MVDSGQPILGQLHLSSTYYMGVRKNGEKNLAESEEFNQHHLLESDDRIIRYIGLDLLRDHISTSLQEEELNLYLPLLKDKDETVRVKAHKNAFSSGLLFPESDFADSVLVSAFDDKYSPDVGVNVMTFLLDKLHLEDHKEIRARFLPIARKYYFEKWWHEPTRDVTARYFAHCATLNIFKDYAQVADFLLNDPSTNVRWEITSGLSGIMLKSFREGTKLWEEIFTRYSSYPIDKHMELHTTLVDHFLFNEEEVETNKAVRGYFLRISEETMNEWIYSNTLWMLGKRVGYRDPLLLDFVNNGIESEVPEIRRTAEWMQDIIKAIYKRKRPTSP